MRSQAAVSSHPARLTTSAILGAGLVPLETRLPAIAVHLAKVHGAIDATPERAHVRVEGELAILQLEQLRAVWVQREGSMSGSALRAAWGGAERAQPGSCSHPLEDRPESRRYPA